VPAAAPTTDLVQADGPAGRLVVRLSDPSAMPAEHAAMWRECRLTARTAWDAAATLFRHKYGTSAGRGGEMVCGKRGWWKSYGQHRKLVFEIVEVGPSPYPGYSLWAVWPVGKVVGNW
jgi:hypothetical protein